ncbi:14 kDa phosphohistidine phosphatase isoform X1 [Equus przewalskii]|uniref:14 kDa phosphohistidine phosphatase n=1 Tax=Equus przewalskii TaxID=9798 RepID=A0ABM4MF00_EQUPR
MAEADLAQIPDVDIDSDGVFKYVLIRVHAAPPSGTPAGESKEIVRGYKWAEYHVQLPGPGRIPSSLSSRPSLEGLLSWGRSCSELRLQTPWASRGHHAEPPSPSQPTSTTRYPARCRRRATAASAWEVGASPTRARTRKSTCMATPWVMVVPNTPSPQRKSKPGTPTTRSPGPTTATEALPRLPPLAAHSELCP